MIEVTLHSYLQVRPLKYRNTNCLRCLLKESQIVSGYMKAVVELQGIESSYIENSYGDFFYAITQLYKPQSIVELGTFMGYSALHMAAAFRDCPGSKTQMFLVDLWDNYPYRHCSLETTRDNFTKNKLLILENCEIDFLNQNAYEVADTFDNASVDLLHVDISNDGESLGKIMSLWHDKIREGGILLMEGGSPERDKIPWMIEYKKTPIADFLNSNWFKTHYEFVILCPYPSLTFARRIK